MGSKKESNYRPWNPINDLKREIMHIKRENKIFSPQFEEFKHFRD